MFAVLEKIDKALETKAKCTLLNKMGGFYTGIVTDSWIRVSGSKLRGKLIFQSEEDGEMKVDCNDILDIRFTGEK